MKLAIIGSGQCRKLLQTNLNKSFEKFNKDFYFHTWDHELNPNVNKLQNFFPDAKIEIEKYEDRFDRYLEYKPVGRVDNLRYEFAQFYTVLKSFKLVDNKDYDFFIRTRTDISYPTDLHSWFNPNDIHWPHLKRKVWHALKSCVDQSVWRTLTPHLQVRHLLENTETLDNRVMDIKPIILSPIRLVTPNGAVMFDDFSWIMNRQAFDKISELDIDETMKFAMDLKIKSEFTLQSPIIWSEIFRSLGIYIIDAPVGGNIIRNKGDKQELVPQYGDIS